MVTGNAFNTFAMPLLIPLPLTNVRFLPTQKSLVNSLKNLDGDLANTIGIYLYYSGEILKKTFTISGKPTFIFSKKCNLCIVILTSLNHISMRPIRYFIFTRQFFFAPVHTKHICCSPFTNHLLRSNIHYLV